MGVAGSRPTIDVAAKYVIQPIVTPANTPSQVQTFDLGRRTLQTVDIFYANGHNGLLGVNVAYSGVALAPWNQPNSFLVGNNERRLFDLAIDLGGPVTITTQNNDLSFTHTVVLTFKLTEYSLLGAPLALPVLPLDALNV